MSSQTSRPQQSPSRLLHLARLPHVLRTLPSLPVVKLIYSPPDPAALSQPPALLRPALLAVAKLHSRTLRPHPGLRHRLLSAERRPSRFAPRGSRSPARNREGTQGGYRLTVMHYTRMTAAAVNAASAAVSIPATPHFLLPKTTTPRKHREGPAAPGMHRSSQSEATLDCGPCRRACGCVHQADTPTDASLRSL